MWHKFINHEREEMEYNGNCLEHIAMGWYGWKEHSEEGAWYLFLFMSVVCNLKVSHLAYFSPGILI